MDARGYRLGVDFGTSNTVAMLAWPDGHVRPLLFDGSPTLPSSVYADPQTGLLVGRDAVHAARISPERFEPNPKRRIDEPAVLLGEAEIPTIDLFAAVLARVAGEARRVSGGQLNEVTITCPVAWAQTRRGVVLAAAERAGLGQVTLVPEPVAAASVFLTITETTAAPGSAFVVYDLGAGTFDASVVRHGPAGFEVLAAEGLSTSGGLDIDAAIVAYLGATYAARDPATWSRLVHPTTGNERRANRLLWDDVRSAKEMLSRTSATMIHLPMYDEDAPLGRDQFELLARPILTATVTATRAAIAAAQLAPADIAGVFLVGGGSRIPLVATLLHQALGKAPTAVEQPELVVAQGGVGASMSGAATAGPTSAPPAGAYGAPSPGGYSTPTSAPPAGTYGAPSSGGYSAPTSAPPSGTYAAAAPASGTYGVPTSAPPVSGSAAGVYGAASVPVSTPSAGAQSQEPASYSPPEGSSPAYGFATPPGASSVSSPPSSAVPMSAVPMSPGPMPAAPVSPGFSAAPVSGYPAPGPHAPQPGGTYGTPGDQPLGAAYGAPPPSQPLSPPPGQAPTQPPTQPLSPPPGPPPNARAGGYGAAPPAAAGAPAKSRRGMLVAVAVVVLLVLVGGAYGLSKLGGKDNNTGSGNGGAATQGTDGQQGGGSSDGADQSPATVDAENSDTTWYSTATAYDGHEDAIIAYDCPKDGSIGTVWGAGPYTTDSSVCTAAVHAGYISLEDGGRVLIQIQPGQDSYEASLQHGIQTTGYGKFDWSFNIAG